METLNCVDAIIIVCLSVVSLWMFESALRHQKRANVAEEQNIRLKMVVYDLMNSKSKT